MSWNLAGSYVETCSCELMCPCNLSLDHGATYDFCRVTLVFIIREGAVSMVEEDGDALLTRRGNVGVPVAVKVGSKKTPSDCGVAHRFLERAITLIGEDRDARGTRRGVRADGDLHGGLGEVSTQAVQAAPETHLTFETWLILRPG